jgi:hypothetical protein
MNFISELIAKVSDFPRALVAWHQSTYECNRYSHIYLDAVVASVVILSIAGVFIYRWLNKPKPRLQLQ